MKKWPGIAILLLTLVGFNLQAGVSIGGTRVIFDGRKKEASINVSNPDQVPYLIQSWVESDVGNNNSLVHFVITPPLFRLDAEQQNQLRIVHTQSSLSSDKEALYWLNIKSIPTAVQSDNTLQIAVKTRLKLIYRPQSLTDKTPEAVTEELIWRRVGQQLQVENPTAYYMNFQTIRFNGRDLPNVTHVAPLSLASFSLPSKEMQGEISWQLIGDHGAVGATHSSRL